MYLIHKKTYALVLIAFLSFATMSGPCWALPSTRPIAGKAADERPNKLKVFRSSPFGKKTNNKKDARSDDTIRTVEGRRCAACGWFRPHSTPRERALATWLLLWNSIALLDAIRYTFLPRANLGLYLEGEWGPHALAQTRMLANCQLGLITTIVLVAFTANEKTLKRMFHILVWTTMGALRAVFAGVQEGTIKSPWNNKTGYAALMSLPPLFLLAYFAFVF